MNLVEFPDDNIAFDPNKVTSIVGKAELKFNSPDPTCAMDCPDRYDGYSDHSIDYCENKEHYDSRLVDYTIVSVAGKDLTVVRPFQEVMLIITANLMEPVYKKHDFFSARPEVPPLPVTEEEEKAYLMRDWE